MALRIAVLGNCQAEALGRCLERFCPQAKVMSVYWAPIASPEQAEAIAAEVVRCDVVFTQPLDKPAYGPLCSDELIARTAGRVQLWPRLYFTGLQPDVVRIGKGKRLGRTFGVHHSALILAGFALGMSPERTAELFNAYVYGLLGYYDEYAKAEAFLSESGRAAGLDLRPLVERWRGEVGFHVPNHPRIELLAGLGALLCDAMGLDRLGAIDPPEDVFEDMTVWPVYPEIARRLGVPGSMVFRRSGEPRELDLGQTIVAYHAVYARADDWVVRKYAQPAADVLRAEVMA